MTDPVLAVQDVRVVRGERTVLSVERLEIAAGETLAILGPNGAGKTTLLQVLALLVPPSSGALKFEGRPVEGRDAVRIRRRMAVVFQRPLLLDRTVLANVELGLALRGHATAERRARARSALSMLGVGHLGSRHARALSGGEAQRVSLARAFALEPSVLLLDEPFAALDAPSRELLTADVARLLRERRITTVLVTHDRDEALSLADRIGVILDGRIRQVGPAAEVFAMPADPEVAAFVGIENVLPARVVEVTAEITRLRVADSIIEVTALPPAGDDFPLLCVRPDDVVIQRTPADTSARNALAARVVRVEPVGRRVRVILDCGFPLVAHVTVLSARDLGLTAGETVTASFKATVPHLLPRHRATRPDS